MLSKFRFRMILESSALILILSLFLVPKTQAEERTKQAIGSSGEGQGISAVASPVPGGPGYVALSALAFHPYVSTDNYGRFGQTLYCISGGCSFNAEITLPHGATITKFVAYYYDNSLSDLQINLEYAPLFDEYTHYMAINVSSGQSDQVRFSETTTIDPSVIDNQSNSYLFEVFMPRTMDVRLVGVRVDYSFPTMLPNIHK